MVNLIITVAIAALVVFFTAQNSSVVTVSFLFWKIDAPLSVVVFLSVLAGILLAATVALSGFLKRVKKSDKKK